MTDLGIVGVGDAVLIASGGSALVYRAITGAGRDVAVKVLRGMRGAEVARRFEREQSAAERLQGHPHVITILDSGVTPAGEPYLVMPYLPRGSLADELDTVGRFELEQAVTDVATAAAAIDYAHLRGVLHRDIKPANLLRADDGSVVVSDFGIARVVDAGISSATVGASTPLYAAPELLAENDASVSSDVYALGALLYTLLAGEAAFSDSQNIWGTMHRIRTESPPPIPGVPEPVMQVIDQAMAKDPADRPVGAAVFRRRLLEALDASRAPLVDPLPQIAPAAATTTIDLPDRSAAPLLPEPPPPPPIRRPVPVVGDGPPRGASAVRRVAVGVVLIAAIAGLAWLGATRLADGDGTAASRDDTPVPTPTTPDPTGEAANADDQGGSTGGDSGDSGGETADSADLGSRFVRYTGAHYIALLPEGWSLESGDVDVGYGFRSRFVADGMYLNIDTTPAEQRPAGVDIADSARDVASGIRSASEVRTEVDEGLTLHFFTFRNTSGVDSIDIFFEVDGDGYAIVAGSASRPEVAFATARQVALSIRSNP